MNASESQPTNPPVDIEPVPARASALDELLAQKQRSSRARLLGVVIAVPLVVAVIALAISLTRGVGITVTPTEVATTAQIKVIDGLGVVVRGNVYALSETVGIEVSAPTFFTAQAEIETSGSSNYLEVELQPKPAVLVATVENPTALNPFSVNGTDVAASTQWFLDGERVAQGHELSLELPPGSYELIIDNPYHELAARSLELTRAEERNLSIALEPVQGSLAIASQPAGANVSINGIAAGRAQLAVPLQGGDYAVALTLPSHGAVTETIKITRGQNQLQRNYALIANPAYLEFQIGTSDARLVVDGKTIANPQKNLTVTANATHSIVFERPGFHTLSQTLTLTPGERRAMPLTLQPNIGELQLASRPSATIALNGQVIGESPQTLELPATPQTISFSKPGYHSVSRVVTPTDTNTQLITVELQTELQHRLATMPAELVNSAGITLRRFQPNEQLRLGAPRSEKGQRANETLRNVELTKAFYVSLTEITNGQYQAFERTSGAANAPKTGISWLQAAQFCNWLSAKEGLEAVYRFRNAGYAGADVTADGYRLPTEAEWEWLARQAGRRELSRFTWGDDYQVPERAGNLADESAKGQTQFYIPRYTDGFAQLAPVGSFAPELSGLRDMSGNVSEWVHDFYTIPLPTPPDAPAELNPFGPSQGEGHVLKGSSWRSGNASQLRAAYRDNAVQAREDVGFRVARYVYGK